MFVSGYVYHITGEWRSKGTRLLFIEHKLKNLGVPYIVFSIIYILINSCIGSTNTQFSASDILRIWEKPVAQYWFLYSLLLLFILWAILSKWMKNYQTMILLAVIGYVRSVTKIPLSEGILEMLPCVIPFGLGTCVSQNNMKWVYEKAKTPAGFLVVFVHCVVTTIYLINGTKNYVLVQAVAVLGVLASIVVVVNIGKFRIIESALLYITKYSFVIYLLHTIFTAGVRVVLVKLGIKIYLVHVLCGCAVGLLVPVFVAIGCKKIGIYDYLFAPAKVWKKRE